jgi:hypothetical protein
MGQQHAQKQALGSGVQEHDPIGRTQERLSRISRPPRGADRTRNMVKAHHDHSNGVDYRFFVESLAVLGSCGSSMLDGLKQGFRSG